MGVPAKVAGSLVVISTAVWEEFFSAAVATTTAIAGDQLRLNIPTLLQPQTPYHLG